MPSYVIETLRTHAHAIYRDFFSPVKLKKKKKNENVRCFFFFFFFFFFFIFLLKTKIVGTR